jgi:hypothetical protein
MSAHQIMPDRLVELGTAYRRAKVLLTAIELDLFTILAERPLSEDALARALGLHSRGARDFFDALVALGLLARDRDGLYSNAPEPRTYLDRGAPMFLGGMFEQFGKREYRMWETLADALRTGEPQTGIQDREHFTALYSDPARFKTFVDAMTAGSLPAARSIASKFRWEDYRTLVDVGTAQGCLPVQVALAHRHISAAGFDLPQLRNVFDDYIRNNGLEDRIQFFPGNFFEDELPPAEVIVFGRVLHNWSASSKQALLKKAYRALPDGGAVIVYDTLIDDDRRSGVGGLLSSLNMLVWTTAGFGYSGADCVGWMWEAGFRDTRVEPLAGGQSMVIGMK